MPFLTARDGRATLRLGSNILGGGGKDAVDLRPLAGLPPTAVLVVRPDALSVIRRLAPKVNIRVDGHSLGSEPAELRHGTRIDIGNTQLTYGHPAPLRAGPGVDPSAVGTELLPSISAGKSEYRLVDSKTSDAVDIPAAGAVLGRERDCDITVGGQGVSRRHATIRRKGDGYELTDQSSNGTLVNGARIPAPHALRSGDLITIGTTEYRWEAKAKPANATRPVPKAGDATELISSIQAPRDETSPAQSAAPKTAEVLAPVPVLATLSNRSLWRKEFLIERPVSAIGRGDHNDVRILHESVSASHATLVRKGQTWFVLDLGSSNGTFVNGLRVAGERELPGGATLTLGKVKLTFRPTVVPTGQGEQTERVGRGEFLRRLANLWEKGSSRKHR